MQEDCAGARTAEWFAPYVAATAAREEKAGGPLPGTPTLRDMQFLYAGLQSLDNCGEGVSPKDIHALMELIADVRDAWTDPENDEIGRVLFPALDEMHFNLGTTLDQAVPEIAENLKKVEDLRALQRAIARQQARHVPGPVESLFNWFGSKFKKTSHRL